MAILKEQVQILVPYQKLNRVCFYVWAVQQAIDSDFPTTFGGLNFPKRLSVPSLHWSLSPMKGAAPR